MAKRETKEKMVETLYHSHQRKVEKNWREKSEKTSTNSNEKFILITSLIYAADRIANTVGHYDAYRENLDTIDEQDETDNDEEESYDSEPT